MKLLEFPYDIDYLLDMVRKAGSIVNEIYQRYLNQEIILSTNKIDQSPLTEADLLSHNYIVTRLREISPEIPVVSEEDQNSFNYRLPTGLFWLIDPLDGTKEFLSKNGEFTINVGLIRDGRAIFGIVYAPVVGKLYWGGINLGAFCEKLGVTSKIFTSQAMPNIPRILISKSHNNNATQEFIKFFGSVEALSVGSSLKFCMVAEGLADCYPRLGPTSEWDTAAAQAILEAAGGFVITMHGEILLYGKPDVINPNFVAISNKHISQSFLF